MSDNISGFSYIWNLRVKYRIQSPFCAFWTNNHAVSIVYDVYATDLCAPRRREILIILITPVVILHSVYITRWNHHTRPYLIINMYASIDHITIYLRNVSIFTFKADASTKLIMRPHFEQCIFGRAQQEFWVYTNTQHVKAVCATNRVVYINMVISMITCVEQTEMSHNTNRESQRGDRIRHPIIDGTRPSLSMFLSYQSKVLDTLA